LALQRDDVLALTLMQEEHTTTRVLHKRPLFGIGEPLPRFLANMAL